MRSLTELFEKTSERLEAWHGWQAVLSIVFYLGEGLAVIGAIIGGTKHAEMQTGIYLMVLGLVFMVLAGEKGDR